MSKAIPIHVAKSTLSKLVQRAKKGETVYIGSYGEPEAIIAPIPKKVGVNWDAAKMDFGDVKDEDIMGIDPDIQEMFYGKDWDK